MARKKKWLPAAAFLTAGCWAISLSTRFTDILYISKGEKITTFVSLLVITSLVSFWLFWVLLPPFIQSFPQKKAVIALEISALLISTYLLTAYQLPPFPEQHQLTITASGEKNLLSASSRVEVISIQIVSLPKKVQKEISNSQLEYEGNWQGSNDSNRLIHDSEQKAALRFKRFMQAGMIVQFQTGPQGGLVYIDWDGSQSLIDLYSEKSGVYTLSLEPTLDWLNADHTRKVLVGGAVSADFFSLLILGVILLIILEQVLVSRKIVLKNAKLPAVCLGIVIFLQIPNGLINQPVEIDNPQLESAIREVLKKPQSNISKNELLSIVELDASKSDISDLNGIEQLSNLAELDLSGNQITDITPLGKLTKLQKLNLKDNAINDLTPLSALTELETLNLQSNTNIISLQPLRELTKLKSLNLANIPIKVEVSTIGHLQNLNHLNLRNCGINDLQFLTQMKGLDYLNLHSNPQIQDLGPLRNLTNLQTLILANIPVAGQIEYLQGLNELTYLNLRGTDLTDISSLSNLTNLTYLNLNSNSDIRSIQPLQSLVKIQTLILADVPVRNQTPMFENFSSLQNLNIRNCQITNLTFLAELMSKGNLQDDVKHQTYATLDIRDNFKMGEDEDPYASLRPYWENISNRKPTTLPFFTRITSPSFSQPTGFYKDSFLLSITSDDPDISIHYTLDSSEPDADSPIYTQPILIETRAGEPNQYSAIDTIAKDWNPPKDEVRKATVVRAKAIQEKTGEASAIVTHTYFVGDDIVKHYTLPVISLVVDPDDLFDEETGIYVLGMNYLNASQSAQSEDTNQAVENYHQHGRDWERPVHFELIEEDSQATFSQDGGVRIHGSSSRQRPQKSLRIYARDDYSNQDIFAYPLFNSTDGEDGGESSPQYKTFLLRNSGQDWTASLMRDILAQKLVSSLDVETQASRPVIVFLNGEYWGFYHLQERYDEYYLRNHFGIDPDQVTILRNQNELFRGSQEDVVDYEALEDFVNDNDLSQPENYAYVRTQMDVDNYIDYQIANIFLANTDWPHNNLYYWRKDTAGYQPNTPSGHDGRWRWMLFDLDFAFGFEGTGVGNDNNTLARAQADDWTGLLFRSLLKNESFKTQFLIRFADIMNTTFKSENVLATIDQTQTTLNPEMKEFFQRWTSDSEESLEKWDNEIERIRVFAQVRPDFVREQIVEQFNLDGIAKLTLDFDSSKGSVQIDSITLDQSSMEGADTWQGIYFQNLPLTLTAIPQPGYTFAGWQEIDQKDEEITLELTQNLSLTALFVED